MKTVLCHGVFDLLTPGHMKHLEAAKALGDILIVSLVPDEFVRKPRPIIYDEETRIFMLESLRYVDRVILCGGEGPEQVIEDLVPDIYVRGHDYIGKRMPEADILEKLGIPTVFNKFDYPRATEVIGMIQSL